MKYQIQGKGPIVISNNNFVAEGGEGKIFITGNTALKIYTDLKNITPVSKIKELMILDHPSIIRPKDILLDEKNQYVGFTMDVIPNSIPLCKLFTTSFRTRNAVTPEMINKLVENMQEVIVFIHDKKCLLVDGNEMNYLVDDHSFVVPYFIDVNSYATQSWPATVVMPSIKDWATKGFNTLTDWFSFAIVSFQLFVGIHPYKGGHPKFNQPDLIERMKARLLAKVSVLNSSVSYPPSVRDFSYIPSEFMDWYVKLFEKGERVPPPKVAGLLNIKQVQATVVQSTNNFIIKLIKDYKDEIVRAKYWNGVGSITTTKRVYINKIDYPISSPKGLDIVFTPKMMVPMLAKIENLNLYLRNLKTDEVIDSGIRCTDKLLVDNTLYVKNEGNLIELVLTEMGDKILPVVKTTWSVLPYSSILFNGVVYQNVLGKSHLSIPKPNSGVSSSCFVIAIPELDGHRILDAKYQNRVCLVVGVKGSITTKFILTFDEKISSYQCRTIQDDSLVNFVTLDNGVCISINDDGSLELFKNSDPKVKVIKDPDIRSTMILTHDGVKVMFFEQNKLYSLSMKP